MRERLQPFRYWGPIVVACICLALGNSVPPWATYVLVVVAFLLLFEVGTAWLAKAGGTGGMNDFKQ